METDIVYQINDFKFFFGKIQILDIKNITIKKNKIYGLVGANGSGKTTLMKILSGLLKTNKGGIYFKGLDIKKCNNILNKQTVYIHQSPYLFSGTVYDNMKYPLYLNKITNTDYDKIIENTLRQLEIQNLKNKNSYELSSGEIQKVAIARALILNREIIFLDEPTSNLDNKSIDVLKKTLIEKSRKNVTLIISSHNSLFLKDFCDEIIYLDNL
ncbi:MAG TPA: ABC transporter ATP-binding protein [Spirochaetota bacterium]|mgnify:FL=1|jgi:tungstate transport system ATP-binding protein|nr:MAG: L-cystine import ATP-binding protein TcyN [Spirochaetes bacterium ADurb.Bin133]HNZ27422.1 ABC transporter ATP-binding protein [Spirochaetota bacterium]HOF02084.1 ABC transporter ATP-binding protein [Spirochaetota bacterium]HOS32079.1 ABC transporter ATP-binding protein [Spirochaetota bacterium]HOS55420.1 ABC transporter ATP-binding protein [Spirochaetota bacterium]